MSKKTLYTVRIPTSDLKFSESQLIDSGLKLLYREEDYFLSWFLLESQIITLHESEQQHPCLVKYVADSPATLDKLDELGIASDFSADENGNHFEASFFDPGGTKILIADYVDIPKEVSNLETKSSFEFSIPSNSDFKDSVNFWHLFGFSVFNNKAKPHAWSSLVDNEFRVAIHQHYEWSLPGLCFPSSSSIKKSQIDKANLRSKLYFSDFF
ncbi:MAG: hypothetical protein MK132_04395 [Lentisphaerales bacterium]|nr:hypothetical protein [Lentisphaerales bacterium]